MKLDGYLEELQKILKNLPENSTFATISYEKNGRIYTITIRQSQFLIDGFQDVVIQLQDSDLQEQPVMTTSA